MRQRVPSAVPEGLLYCLLAFAPFAFGCVEPWSRAAFESLAYLAALACFLRGRRAAGTLGRLAWLFPAGVAALGAVQVLGAAPADLPRPPWPSSAVPHETEQAALLWAAYACILYVVPRVVAKPSSARRFLWFLFGLGAAVTVLGWTQALTSTDEIYWSRPTLRDVPPFGPYYNLDHAANLLLLSLAAGAGLLHSRLSRARAADGPLPGERQGTILLGLGVAALAAGVLTCRSRGALLAACLAGAGTALVAAGSSSRRSRRLGRAALAVGAAAVAVACVFAYVLTGADAGVPMDRSVAARLTIYGDSRRWLADAPLFGTGLGSFASVYPAYQDLSLRASAAHAHSDWLEFALETGFPGLFAALAACALLVGAATRTWRSARSREMRALILGALAAVLAFCAHGLFEFAFQIPANAAWFFALAGFLASAPGWADKADRVPASDPPDAPGALAAVALFAYGGVCAFMPASAASAAVRGGDAADRVAALTRAMERDDDPVFVRELGRQAYALAGDAPEADAGLVRAALGCALEAAASRPFDPGALRLAGDALWRLRRGADAAEFLERARLARFSPIQGRAAAGPDGGSLSSLRELGLLPGKEPAR